MHGRKIPTYSAALLISMTGVKPSPVEEIQGARVLPVLGRQVTTDHISPAGSIKKESPAGRYLQRAWRQARGLQSLRIAPAAITKVDGAPEPSPTLRLNRNKLASAEADSRDKCRRPEMGDLRPLPESTSMRARRWSCWRATNTAPGSPGIGAEAAALLGVASQAIAESSSAFTFESGRAWESALQFLAGQKADAHQVAREKKRLRSAASVTWSSIRRRAPKKVRVATRNGKANAFSAIVR